MPAPISQLETLRPDLGGSMEEFDLAADRAGFIGHRVLPVLEVAKQSGRFGVIPIEQMLQSPDDQRAPGSAYGRGNWKFKTASYATEEHGWEEPVDQREASMYREYFDAELVSAERARDVVLRNKEIRTAGMLFDASTFTPTNVTTPWSNLGSADPVADVDARAQAMWAACGLWPNALIINRRVYRNLRRCDAVLDKIKYVRGTLQGEISVADLQAAFDLPFILVAGGAANTADEGQSASITPLWSSSFAGVARIATRNDVREPCIGRTFHWGEDGSSIGAVMESYYEPSVRGDIIRARMDVQEKLIHEAAFELLGNITG